MFKKLLLIAISTLAIAGCTQTPPPVTQPVVKANTVEWCITPKTGSKICLQDNFSQDETAEVSLQDVDKASEKIEVKTVESSLGAIITEVNGYKPTSKEFWEFKVNGQQSSVGVSEYLLIPGDKLELALSSIE